MRSAAAAASIGLVVATAWCSVPPKPEAARPGVLLRLVLPLVERARRRAAGARNAIAVVDGLPEVLDLLALVVGAGATTAQAVEAVGRRGDGPLAIALAEARRRAADRSMLLADAIAEIPGALGAGGDAVRPLTAALADSSRHGTALLPALERLSDDARTRRRHRAEARARRVPVLLLFPLVTCTLPALGLLTVAPLLIGSLRSLRH